MDKRLSIVEHLEELRRRIIRSLFSVIIASCICYIFAEDIMSNLIKPVGNLVFIAPQEAFVSNIKIAIFSGFILSSPVVIYQIWRFISVALRPNEIRYVYIFGPLSFLFFIIGAIFSYTVIVPFSIRFLLSFATEHILPMITISKYISFVGGLTLAFGVIFELPLLSLFLTRIGVITPYFLSGKRKYAIVFIFLLAAVITPPDVVTQCLMALPLMGLYELGIIFSKIAYRFRGNN